MKDSGNAFDFDLDPTEIAAANHYDGQYRPQFHYTPKQGCIGDATGLIRFVVSNETLSELEKL